ncbi:MAG: hypothetical protein NZ772_14395 [Cyanobacteria bacterium]|nr:hypothetical protein [Cyanobacteriota bacterium]MDW8202554.1 hypothetical protein [Cyanobacteriota bacterium SKYGB_h_bin112]
MNQELLRSLRQILPNLRGWLMFIGALWLVGVVGLGRVLESIAVLIIVFSVMPVVGLLALQWWVGRNLVQDDCPICGATFAGLSRSEINCPNCGEPLRVEKSGFVRLTPPGTIDVDAVEVPSQRITD